MRNLIIAGAICFILCIWSWGYFFNRLGNAVDEMESIIGETVIIETDTLIILDYSMINSSYRLSDGRDVNEKLISKLLENN